MNTPIQQYNELLYNITDFNEKLLIEVERDTEGYPIFKSYGIYYYKDNDKYIRFNGTLEDVKRQWPNGANAPVFYEEQDQSLSLMYAITDFNYKTLILVDIGEDGYPLITDYHTYYYQEKDSDNYTRYTGKASELKNKWPNVSQLPTFYKERSRQYYAIRSDETIYKIDLNSRTVEVPQFLSVYKDHNAEVVWFSVDRFYDDIDLFGSTCYIQYKNALNEQHISIVIPQVIKETDHDMLYIPWPITSAATKGTGNITFAFQFFKLSDNKTDINYSINTKPVTSKILNGLHVDALDEEVEDDNNYNPTYSELMATLNRLAEDYSHFAKEFNIYWLEP